MLQTAKKGTRSYSPKQKTGRKEKKWGTIVIYTLFLIFIGLMLVIYIGQSFKITRLNFKIEKLEQDLNTVEEKNHQYKLKVAQKSSLAKIEKIARNKLHMIEPEKTEIVVLNKDNNIDRKEIDVNKEKMYVFKFFDNLMHRIGTVSAGAPQ